jgi:hypothetical protein
VMQKYSFPIGMVQTFFKYILLGCTLVFTTIVDAQVKDSIAQFLKYKPSPIGGLSGKYSIVQGKPNGISGVYGGAAFGEKFKTWAGFYWMNDPLSEEIYDPSQPNLGVLNTKYEHMRYFSVAAEYAFLHRDKWKLSVPIQLGVGRAREWYVSKFDKSIFNKTKKPVFPLEVGFNAQYMFFDWLGAKAGLGTRFALGKGTSAVYSGPYSTIGILFYFEPLYRKLPENWQIIPEKF